MRNLRNLLAMVLVWEPARYHCELTILESYLPTQNEARLNHYYTRMPCRAWNRLTLPCKPQKMPNLFFFGAAGNVSVFGTAAALFSRLALKHVNVTIRMAEKSSTNATSRHQMPFPNTAWLPDLSPLTWCRSIPNRLKSVASTISTNTQAPKATTALMRDPKNPAPMETSQAMNAVPHAMGCRTITRVRLSEVPPAMSEICVRSAAAMTWEGA